MYILRWVDTKISTDPDTCIFVSTDTDTNTDVDTRTFVSTDTDTNTDIDTGISKLSLIVGSVRNLYFKCAQVT